jgi:hypothetical protein
MGKQRTAGMTTIGVLNITFGAYFSLVFLLKILAAGFMATAGNAIGGEDGAAVAAGAGFLLLAGIAACAINLMLFISGIGVLRVAPWGRTLSLVCGGLGVVVYTASLVGNGFLTPYLGMLAYSFLLVGLFFMENWKNTYCSCESVQLTTESAPASSETSESEETREAA